MLLLDFKGMIKYIDVSVDEYYYLQNNLSIAKSSEIWDDNDLHAESIDPNEILQHLNDHIVLIDDYRFKNILEMLITYPKLIELSKYFDHYLVDMYTTLQESITYTRMLFQKITLITNNVNIDYELLCRHCGEFEYAYIKQQLNPTNLCLNKNYLLHKSDDRYFIDPWKNCNIMSKIVLLPDNISNTIQAFPTITLFEFLQSIYDIFGNAPDGGILLEDTTHVEEFD